MYRKRTRYSIALCVRREVVKVASAQDVSDILTLVGDELNATAAYL